VAFVEVWIFSDFSVITQYSSSALTNPMEIVHDIGWCSSMNKKNTNKVFECKGFCRNNFIWSFPLHSNMFNIYKDLKQKYALHWTSITQLYYCSVRMYLDVIMLHSYILSFILQVKSFTVPQDISQWIKMLNS
jgi:hypothetical protein